MPQIKIRRSVSLPESLHRPAEDFADYSMLLYGRKKIGKTTLAASFPEALILATEPGAKALSVRQIACKSIENVEDAISLLEEQEKAGKQYCKTLVIDTIDLVYEYAWDRVCSDAGVEHARDAKDYGATYKKIRSRFRSVLIRALNLACGTVLISHDTAKEIELPSGETVERRMPTMASAALQEVEGVVDTIAFYDYAGSKRVLVVRGDESLVAGTRCVNNFLTVDKRQVVSIPLGSSPKEAYGALLSAFANKMKDPAPAGEAPKYKIKS